MNSWIRNQRPKLHFAPQKGWINDPNGLVYDGMQYHLFAQHNPNDIVWGPMHWLHAVSGDLLHWREWGIALFPDALGTIFSGSAVIDTENTAGFGRGAMIAMYTLHGERETQGIAYSLDGVHFTPYEGNPVIENPGIADFRDPKLFWNAQDGCWAMALAAGDCIAFYRSSNMLTWEKTGAFGKDESRYGNLFECPDLFALTAPDGRTVWVLLVSMGGPAQMGGGRMQYYLGEFDGKTFHRLPEQQQAYWVDAGFDNYAGVTYSGAPRPTYFGWAANPVYAGKVPAGSYRGCMTLPRRPSIINTNAGLRLAFEPILPEKNAAVIQSGGLLAPGAYELNIHAQGPFEIRLMNDLGEFFRFGLDQDERIYADRSNAGGTGFDAHYDSALYRAASTQRLLSGPFEMRLILDHTLIEMYADQGAYTSTLLVFPAEPFTHIACDGAASIKIASLA